MLPQPDDLKIITESVHWSHILPFAALITGEPISENRSAMTRLVEQGFVGIVAAVVGSFATLKVHQSEIATLKSHQLEYETRTAKALTEAELRLSAQITELRAFLLQNKK